MTDTTDVIFKKNVIRNIKELEWMRNVEYSWTVVTKMEDSDCKVKLYNIVACMK